MNDERAKQTPESDVVLRRLEHEQTDGRYAVGVFCPRRQRPVDVRACRDCEHCHGLRIDPAGREIFLRCDAVSGELGATRDENRPTASRETTLGAIMSRTPVCVTAQTKITVLTELLLHHGISGVPVIDALGVAVGVVSNSDLIPLLIPHDQSRAIVRFKPAIDGPDIEVGLDMDSDRVANMTVGDVMHDGVYALGVDAAISRAAGLMAYECVHRIVVTGADGVPVGIVSSLDILRWLARCAGYVLPELTRSPDENTP